MKKLEEFKKKFQKQKLRNEQGSVTLFVIIAMLFFLTVGLIIFIANVNNSSSQRRDVRKIQSEYNRISNEELNEIYNEQVKKQTGKLVITVIDRWKEIYETGTWANLEDNKLPLTIYITWPEGIKESDKVIRLEGTINGQEIEVEIKDGIISGTIPSALNIENLLESTDKGFVIRDGVTDCRLEVTATVNGDSTKVEIKVDQTNPTGTIEPNGGEYLLNPGNNETGKTLESTISASDTNSGVKEIKYIWSEYPTTPGADSAWQTITNGTKVTSTPLGEGVYYLYVKVTDQAGNETIIKSSPYFVKVANYQIITGNSINYAETLVEAVEAASDGSTINLLKNYEDTSVTDTNNAGNGVVISKNIVIDLAGHTITRGSTITNNGTVDIYSSADNGTLTGASDHIIDNTGTLTINGTSEDHTITISSTSTSTSTGTTTIGVIVGQGSSTLTVNRNATIEFTNAETINNDRYVILSRGLTTINGATIRTSASGLGKEHGVAIPKDSGTGRIVINNGTTISTRGCGIYNGGNKTGNEPTVEIYGDESSPSTITTITSLGNNAINNVRNGEIDIYGGRISSSYHAINTGETSKGTINVMGGTITSTGNIGINNSSSGTIKVTGGTVTGRYRAIRSQNENGKVIIGDKDQAVNKTTPEIKAVDSSSTDETEGYAIIIGSTSTLEFYSGKLISKCTSTVNGRTVAFKIADETKASYRIDNQGQANETQYVPTTRKNGSFYETVLDVQMTVTANANGGTIDSTEGWTGTGDTATKTVTYDSAYGTLPIATKTGYTLRGWKIDGQGDAITSETIVSRDSNHTLYADWTANSYELVKVGANNILTNEGFEDYKIVDNPGWDGTLNGVPGDPTKAYYVTNWGSGYNSLGETTSIGYHAHMKMIDGNAVFDFKTNEDYSGSISTNRFSSIGQFIDGDKLVAGKKYAITMDVYRVSGTGYMTGALYYATNANNSLHFENNENNINKFNPSENGRWETLTCTFTLSSDYLNTVRPKFIIYGHVGTTEKEMYIDNVRLEEIEEKEYDTTYTSANLAEPTKEGYTFQGWYNDSAYTTMLTTSDKFDTTKATFSDVNTAGITAFIYSKWTPRTDTAYTVKHYQMDINGNYPEEPTETQNLTGTTDAQVTPEVNTYTGFTSPATQTVSINGDGSTVVEYRYERNKYVLDVNGYLDGVEIDNVSGYGTFDVSINGEQVSDDVTDYYSELYYGSTYEITDIKDANGYKYNGVHSGELNGTMAEPHIVYLDFTTQYTITYDLNGGSMAGQTTTYDIYTDTFTLPTPTKENNVFSGWSEEITNMRWYKGFLNLNTGVIEPDNTTYPDSYYTNLIKLKAGVTYTLSGYKNYSTSYIRYRIYNLDGTYRGNIAATSTVTVNSDGYVRILLYNNPTEEQRNGAKLSSAVMSTVEISKGSQGNRRYTANWTEANYSVSTSDNNTYYYLTLKEAVERADATGSTVTVLQTCDDTSASFTIDKDITIDTNGKTVTMASTITVASGKTLNISGNGTIKKTSGDLITNNGSIITQTATLEAGENVINGGNVTVKSGTINGGTHGIYVTSENSTIIIGEENATLDELTPVIIGSTEYGINITKSSSTLVFYNGSIKGAKTTTNKGVSVAFVSSGTTTYRTGYGAITYSEDSGLNKTLLGVVQFSLNPQEVYLNLSNNRTGSIAPTGSSYGTVTYSSSDETIARVNSEGSIEARTAGTTTITATEANSGKTATCTVVVDTVAPIWTITIKEIR